LSQRLRVVTFGDSTANVGRIHSSTAVPINAVAVSGSDTVGIGEMAIWALPVHFPMAQLIGHFGIDGQDTSLMLADDRQAPFTGQPMAIQDVINIAPNLVILRGGSINDLQGATSSNIGAVVANCVANHRQIVQRMVDGGLKVLDCGIFGYGDGSLANAGSPGSVRSALLQVNNALATMAGEFGNAVRYVSPLNALHDASGRFLPGMTNDGIHLSLAGGLAQARLEADVIAPWLGAGTGTAYPGTNLMVNANMQSTGGPGVTPVGYSAFGFDNVVDNQQVESIGGKTFFTVRVTLPAAGSYVVMRLPFALAGLGANEVIGCEFDFFFDRLSGSVPRLVEVDARQDFAWGGGTVVHRAGFSARATSTTTTFPLSGRIVFLPFRLPASGSSFFPGQTLLGLNLGFAASSSSVVKIGIGNPRLARV
jgi:hypothetical protein